MTMATPFALPVGFIREEKLRLCMEDWTSEQNCQLGRAFGLHFG